MEPTLKSRMESDLKVAMKSGDVLLRDTLRFILSGLKNAEIDKRGPLTPDETQALLLKQGKRMQESIDQFVAGGREDLADHERAQMAIVKRYLPAEFQAVGIKAAKAVLANIDASGELQ